MAELEKTPKKRSKKASEKVEQPSISGPGELLTEAREKLKLSTADIAQQLNLSAKVIEQLESNNYKGDIPDAFIRGYLRTYARAVEIDEEQVVAIYTQSIGLEIVRNYYVPSNDIAPIKSSRGTQLLWFKVFSVVFVIAMIVLAWMAISGSKDDESSAGNLLNNSSSQNSTATIAVEESATGSELETNQDGVNQPVAIDLSESSNAEASVSQAPITEAAVVESSVSAGIEVELEFTFIEDVWIQVIDKNEEVMAVGLKSAGRRFTVQGVAPISVVIGKPRAVSLQFNNQSVDLSIYPAGQTARFTLGEASSSNQLNAD